MTATVNRDDFAWALAAVLPHAGRAPLDCIGMHSADSQLLVYATDRYTVGVARLPIEGDAHATLSVAESKALEKDVRIGRVADKEQSLTLLDNIVSYGYDGAEGHSYNDLELHLAVVDNETPPDEWDSAVYWQRSPLLQVERLWDAVSRVLSSAPERLGVETREYTYNPALLGRFSKATRLKTDSLRMYPYAIEGRWEHTLALVTVGDNFLGGICGMNHGAGIKPVLDSWFKEAA